MKVTANRFLLFTGIILTVFGSTSVKAQTVEDANGNVYKTIKHGVQEWTSSNLQCTKFRNGDAIPEAKTPEEWQKAGAAGKPAWCYYNNDPENGKKYGKLYNWYAINDPRGLAPKGWRIPTNTEWGILIKNLIGVDIAGERLKSTKGWKSKPGSDKIGFAALPAGLRNSDGKFEALDSKCYFWSNSVPVDVVKNNMIYSVVLKDSSVEVSYLQMNKGSGLSVRITKENP